MSFDQSFQTKMLSQITAENAKVVVDQLSGAGSLLWQAASSYAGSFLPPVTPSLQKQQSFGKLRNWNGLN